MSERYPDVEVKSRAALRAWLTQHHASSPGIWLVTYKKRGAGARHHLPYGELVEELLCFGWVDSKVGKLDADRSRLLCTPRKPRSSWSKPNKDRVARMLAAGLMRPAGLAMVELARRTGTWSALDAVEALTVPDDLAAAFTAVARAHWEAFPRSVRRGVLEWIATARRPETRAARIAETARLAAKNQRANQWRPGPERE